MVADNQPPRDPGNQWGADPESGRTAPNVSIECAIQDVFFPGKLSLGDHLILHALGVAWSEESLVPKRRRVQKVVTAVCHKAED